MDEYYSRSNHGCCSRCGKIDKSFAVLAKGILLDEGISSKYLCELLIEDTKGGIDWNPNPLPKMTYFRNSLKGVHTNRSETSTDLLFPYIYSLLISFLLRMGTTDTSRSLLLLGEYYLL